MSLPTISVDRMQEIDRIVPDRYDITTQQLMENAGYQIADHLRQQFPADSSIQIHTGKGHNGGDGLVTARRLHGWGHDVSIVPITHDLEGLPAKELASCQALGVPIQDEPASTDVIVDGLIGYSLDGAPRPPFDDVIQQINSSDADVVSIDVPSGLDPATGTAHDPHIDADQTVTLGLPKEGMQEENSGEIWVADIGIPQRAYQDIGIDTEPVFSSRSRRRYHRQ